MKSRNDAQSNRKSCVKTMQSETNRKNLVMLKSKWFDSRDVTVCAVLFYCSTAVQRNFYCRVQSTNLLPTHTQSAPCCSITTSSPTPRIFTSRCVGLCCLAHTKLGLSKGPCASINWLSVCVLCMSLCARFCLSQACKHTLRQNVLYWVQNRTRLNLRRNFVVVEGMCSNSVVQSMQHRCIKTLSLRNC